MHAGRPSTMTRTSGTLGALTVRTRPPGRVRRTNPLTSLLRPGVRRCVSSVLGIVRLGRSYLCQDILRRVLEAAGITVHQVMGMTDIDDKILQRAAELGVPWLQLARSYEERFLEDMDALGVWARHTAREHVGRPFLTEAAARARDLSLLFNSDRSCRQRPSRASPSSFPRSSSLSRV